MRGEGWGRGCNDDRFDRFHAFMLPIHSAAVDTQTPPRARSRSRLCHRVWSSPSTLRTSPASRSIGVDHFPLAEQSTAAVGGVAGDVVPQQAAAAANNLGAGVVARSTSCGNRCKNSYRPHCEFRPLTERLNSIPSWWNIFSVLCVLAS